MIRSRLLGWITLLLLLLGWSATALPADATLPVPLTLRYVLLYGNITVGHVTKTLERDKDGLFHHHSQSVPQGMARWFTHVVWHEEGQLEIVDGKVRPLRFLEYRVGADKPHRHEAIFDWQAKKIRYATGVVLDLPPDTQDQGSLLFAFMLHPPSPGKAQTLHISTGKKLHEYRYSDAGQEVLNTDLGRIKTRIIDRVLRDPDEEKFRIWLATDHHNLPVRIETIKRGQSTVLELESASGAMTLAAPKK